MAADPETTTEAPSAEVTFDNVQFGDCPRCAVGVTYVTRWDPEATHEQGDNAALVDNPSGGAYEVRCFNCDFRESRAFNAETDRGEAE